MVQLDGKFAVNELTLGEHHKNANQNRALENLVEELKSILKVKENHEYAFSKAAESLYACVETFEANPNRDCALLNQNLHSFYESFVLEEPARLGIFLDCLRVCQPVLGGMETLLPWWKGLIAAILCRVNQKRDLVKRAVDFVLSILICDDGSNCSETGKFSQEFSRIYLHKVFELYLDKEQAIATYLENDDDAYTHVHLEEIILIVADKQMVYFVKKQYRLQTLQLLAKILGRQGPRMYQILETPLFGHLLDCLKYDSSAIAVSLALKVVSIFLPNICNSVGPYLEQLFRVYVRVLCWDRLSLAGHQQGMDEKAKISWPPDVYHEVVPSIKRSSSSETTLHELDDKTGWISLDGSEQDNQTPNYQYYFTILYGLYPINLIEFLRTSNETDVYNNNEIEEDLVRIRTERLLSLHSIHPNFITYTAESELEDQLRWIKLEPPDIVANCISLRISEPLENDLINSFAIISTPIHRHEASKSIHSFPATSRPNDESIPLIRTEVNPYDMFKSPRQTPFQGELLQNLNTTDCRTLPYDKTTFDSTQQIQTQTDICQSESVVEDLNADKAEVQPEQSKLALDLMTIDRASEKLHLRDHLNVLERSFLVDMPSSDLRRQVILLLNEIEFQKYLKAQQSKRIGRLQREHVLNLVREAEYQNLLHANKTLKVQLVQEENTIKAQRAEFSAYKSQRLKFEGQLNAKVREATKEIAEVTKKSKIQGSDLELLLRKYHLLELEYQNERAENMNMKYAQQVTNPVAEKAKYLDERLKRLESEKQELAAKVLILGTTTAEVAILEGRVTELQMQLDGRMANEERLCKQLRLMHSELTQKSLDDAQKPKFDAQQEQISRLETNLSEMRTACDELSAQNLVLQNRCFELQRELEMEPPVFQKRLSKGETLHTSKPHSTNLWKLDSSHITSFNAAGASSPSNTLEDSQDSLDKLSGSSSSKTKYRVVKHRHNREKADTNVSNKRKS